MIKRLFFPLLAVISASFVSCDNDLDVTADYKEIGVLYGIINPADSVHYFRVQKAFLGEGNALVMSQEPDSTYYPDILDVKLERVKDGNVLETITLTRFVGPDKEAGEFPTGPNILYKTNGEYLFRDSDYRLTVTNTQTGYSFRSQTPLVDTVKIIKPSVGSTQSVSWVGGFPYVVSYYTSLKAEIYNLTIRFKYTEESLSTGQIASKYIDWVFPYEYLQEPQLVPSYSYSIDGEDFYKFVAQKLNPDNTVRRFAGTLDFMVSAGSEVLANYISINSSTTSVLTSIPQYSNVENGTGIFASRFLTVSPNKPMTAASLDSLKNGQYTYDLGFQ